MRPQDSEPWVVWGDHPKRGRIYFNTSEGDPSKAEAVSEGIARVWAVKVTLFALEENRKGSFGCGPLKDEIERYAAARN